jgi:hypothetical protein
MSIPGSRRPTRAWVLAPLAFLLLVSLAGPVSAEAASDRVIRASSNDERTPVAGSGYLSWAESSPDHPRVYGLFVKRVGKPPRRVTPPGVSAFAGDIEGKNLVYQQATGGHSTIRFYGLTTHSSYAPPRGVNSADAWQYGPSMSGRWLLFTRQFSNPTVWKIMLYDFQEARMRTLDRVSGPYARFAQSGQVAGDWATWQVCSPYCKVFVYRISTRQTFFVPNPERRYQYAPTVLEDGTVYFAESHAACGNVTIERFHAGAAMPATVASLPPDTDLSFLSPRTLGDGTFELLYDATSCEDFAGDIRAIRL